MIQGDRHAILAKVIEHAKAMSNLRIGCVFLIKAIQPLDLLLNGLWEAISSYVITVPA